MATLVHDASLPGAVDKSAFRLRAMRVSETAAPVVLNGTGRTHPSGRLNGVTERNPAGIRTCG